LKILKDIELDIPEDIGKEFLTKLMGGKLIPSMEAMLEEKKETVISALEPKAIYNAFKIEDIKGDSVFFDSGHIFKGPNISKILTGSDTAVIFIFTLGSKISGITESEKNSGDALGTIIIDALSTSILGVAGEYVGKIIKDENLAVKGYGATCTYSPGQYKWTIEEQKEIFDMVDGTRIGVELNDSYLMVPFMSVSGVYGFGPEDKINKTRVACDLCPRQDCIGRR
jgi:hypothetical protein